MRRTAQVVLALSLSLWTGGLATISFAVAPTAFRQASSKEEAGKVVGGSLRAFGKVEIACGVASLLASWALAQGGGRWEKIRVWVVFAMLGIALVTVLAIYPEAAVARQKMSPGVPEIAEYFALLHRISVILVSINILLGTAVLAVSAARSRPSDGP
jgi:hypothetical protein